MFHNPFNSKIVSDITNFLNEHRNDVNLTPCLAEKAEAAAEVIAESVVLEDRRNILVDLFNEAVAECGCSGTTKEANDFAKAVEMKLESKKIVVPGKKVSESSEDDMVDEEADEITESVAAVVGGALGTLLAGGFSFAALNFLFDNAFTPSSIKQEWNIFVRRWKDKSSGGKMSGDQGAAMAKEMRALIAKLPKKNQSYLSGIVTRMQNSLKPNKDGKVDMEAAGKFLRVAKDKIASIGKTGN